MTMSTVLLEGLISRQRDLSEGKCQASALHVPGDFLDLHGFTLKILDQDIVALTPCTVAYLPHASVQRLTETEPHLSRLLWLMTNIDASIHREWAICLGSLQAPARMAHLFCELYVRLGLVGLASHLSYELPITQGQLGHCLGLTPVHINRTLNALRREKLVTWDGEFVRIPDFEALASAGEFDPTYLCLNICPR